MTVVISPIRADHRTSPTGSTSHFMPVSLYLDINAGYPQLLRANENQK